MTDAAAFDRSRARTLVLVHGAWHGAWCWDRVITRLSARGVRAVATELPFSSFDDDVAEIRRVVRTSGDDVVLCGHSYGGRLASVAVGELPQVSHLVYLSAQTPNPAQLRESQQNPRPTSTDVPSDAEIRWKYYNRCSEADIRAAAARLRPMVSVPGGLLGLEFRPWETIRSTYIICTDDHAIDAGRQRELAANSAFQAEIDADHSAFYSAPGPLADVLRDIVVNDRPAAALDERPGGRSVNGL